jgi:chemotaxis response regulator CheB
MASTCKPRAPVSAEDCQRRRSPDFIILDVLMPEMGSLDTLQEMMRLDRSLNVIMLSCSNEVGTVVGDPFGRA